MADARNPYSIFGLTAITNDKIELETEDIFTEMDIILL